METSLPCSHGCCASNRDHWLSVSVAPSATPTRAGGARAAGVNATERRWAKDHAAYRRLVADGVQPATLDGAAHLETRADTAIEIETGHLMSPLQRDAFAMVSEGAA